MQRISCRRFDLPVLGSKPVSLNTNEILHAADAALNGTKFVLLFNHSWSVLQQDKWVLPHLTLCAGNLNFPFLIVSLYISKQGAFTILHPNPSFHQPFTIIPFAYV